VKILNTLLACNLSLFLGLNSFAQSGEDLTNYVDPFIGTEKMGHTFPGACAPFGMVQLSPDTDNPMFYTEEGKYNREVYRYCAGYQYDDSSILGFSHTHLSGTGHSDLGDFLIMPTTGKLNLKPGTAKNTKEGYRSQFRHETEQASPGYYKVELDDYSIKAELTATSRVGFHQYTFPKSEDAHIILDMGHGIYNYEGKVLWSHLRVENDTLVTGYRITQGWARTNYLYFAMVFSKPIETYGSQNEIPHKYKGFWKGGDLKNNFPEIAGKDLTAFFDFKTKENEKVKVKFALSAVSTDGALKNLQAEVPHFDFEKTRIETKNRWQNELAKIQLDATEEKKVTFYTSLYHTFINPVEYMDVDGQYRGLDHNVHQAAGFTNYTVFSLWDTYRALHPFLTLVQPERTSDMINSMLAHYDQSVHDILPIWSHFGNENWCMIGYHSVPVIADAWKKGIRGFDPDKALEACVSSATYKQYGYLDSYMEKGYVPYEDSRVGSSMTLEYAYDDWTIAQFAKAVGNKQIEKEFVKRASNWENVFDAEIGFARAKRQNGSWKEDFDPLETDHQGFIEGNSWNYSLYVPHDVKGLVNKTGGEEKFTNRLDSLFTMELPDKYFEKTEDVTREGIMGCYVHGNEPSHQVAYMYNWAGKPWKTAERVHQIINTKYLNKTDGLCGNDDCGQMSAWYIFSSMGFYPVAPGSNEYIIGSPSVEKAVLSLAGNKQLLVRANNLSKENIYIDSVTINGNKWHKNYFTHDDINEGGEIVFKMRKTPNKKWGVKSIDRPGSLTK